MKTTLFKPTKVAMAFALVLGSASAQALAVIPLIINGSLESSIAGTIETVAAGNTANDWTVSLANVEFVKAGYTSGGDVLAAAQDGDWMVDLNGTAGVGQIAQTFATVALQWYEIGFFMSGNAGPNGSTITANKSLAVYWNGGLAGAATYDHLPGDKWSNLRWEGHTLQVQAIGASSTLAFRSTSTTYAAAGPLLDAITVTPVPEAGTWAMLLAGLGAVAFVARRKRA